MARQIIQSGPSEGSLRQQAFQQGLSQISAGLGGLAKQQQQKEQTLRQQALQEQKQGQQDIQTALQISKAGGDITPEQIRTDREMGPITQPAEGMGPVRQTPLGQAFSGIADIAKADRDFKQEQRALDRELKRGQLKKQTREEREAALPFNESRKGKRFLAELEARNKAKQKSIKTGKRKLSAKDVQNVQAGNTIPTQLADISATLEQNKDIFGPIEGRLRGLNPLDEQAQTVDAQMRASAQSFGRFMEGGVLRKEDEEKYRKMFPSLSDTPGVAKNKLAVVNRLLAQKQKGDVDALQAQGFDVSGLASTGEIPAVPAAIRYAPQPGLGQEIVDSAFPQAQAAGGVTPKVLQTMSREQKLQMLRGQ